MSDLVSRTEEKPIPSTGDLVDIYIARTEELRQIAAEEEASDRLIFAYDARRQAAVALVDDPGDALFRLTDRRPDLVEQVQADVKAQSIIDATQRPPSPSVVGNGGAQALADAQVSLETLRQAVQSPQTAEEAAQARGFVERDAERILVDIGTLYAASRQMPATARGLLATVYEPSEMTPEAILSAGRIGERWRVADEAAEAAARNQDIEALTVARRKREIATAALLENRLGVYALAQGSSPLSARAEIALEAEARALTGVTPGSDAEIDQEMQRALGSQVGDPAARYVWLAEEAMAADAGLRRVRLGPRLRARAKAEARAIEAARLNPTEVGDRLGVARLAAFAKDGRPWLASAFGHDRKPEEPPPEPGTIGRTPKLDSYVAEQTAGVTSKAGLSSPEESLPNQSESQKTNPSHERFAFDKHGNCFFTAKALNTIEEGSPTGLFAAYMPQKDGDLIRILYSSKTPALALPFSKWSGSPTIERELTYLYQHNPNRFWTLFEGTRNLSMAILKKPGGTRSLTGEEQMAFDHLQLGLRALAMVAVRQNAHEHEARVEDPLHPLLSQKALAMIESGRHNAAWARAVRDPDGIIQGGRKDQFTERLAEKGLIPSFKETIQKTMSDLNRSLGFGLIQNLSNAFIDESVR